MVLSDFLHDSHTSGLLRHCLGFSVISVIIFLQVCKLTERMAFNEGNAPMTTHLSVIVGLIIFMTDTTILYNKRNLSHKLSRL